MLATTETRRLSWSVALSVVLNAAFLGLIGWLWAPRPERPPAAPRRTMRVAVWTPPPPTAPITVKPRVVKPPPPKRTPRPVVPRIVRPKPRPVVRPKVAPRRATLAAPSRRHSHKSHPRPGPAGGSSAGGAPSSAPLMSATPPQSAPPAPPTPPAPTPAQLAHSSPNGHIAMPKLSPGDAALAAPTLPALPPAGGGGRGQTAGTGQGKGAGEGRGEREGRGTGTGGGDGAGKGAGGGPFGLGNGSGEGPRHIVYVLDVSLSMESRIARAKQEMRDALAGLQDDESFDIIVFGERSYAFDRALVGVTPRTVAQAGRFLNTVQMMPGTNLESALTRALAMDGVNVICVITDGVPTIDINGNDVNDDNKYQRILTRRVREMNINRARIYTIGLVGRDPDGRDKTFEGTRLLQQLSADSGGVSKIVPLGVAMP